ncbi:MULTISPECIES: hypothetical protein [Bradyrhizobium]|uniref:hypothetical protein n=1 Tax=Bradyrhizobium TaxID=374 RepID=UPI001CE393E4|nr:MULTISPECIES: hypothetical protein [Bradyrhizobium]MCA6102349.1 hypothetical protein [Bradyrhizobium australafricanum]MCC8975155.1 hypothetical protein [Bradyrhizobium brasilense]
MELYKENPATLAACGAPKIHLAGASMISDSTPSLYDLQARRLTRRHAVSFEMASTIAPLVFGEVQR